MKSDKFQCEYCGSKYTGACVCEGCGATVVLTPIQKARVAMRSTTKAIIKLLPKACDVLIAGGAVAIAVMDAKNRKEKETV